MVGRTKGYFKENGFKGGIHSAESLQEVAELADKMCGKKYISMHTGPEGYICNCVYIMEQLEPDLEIFLSISIDKKKQMPVITYSKHGG